ncbi:protein of unknown function [Thauera humireducens]|nr:protein of unknown function [Thauera humireducens]
MCLKYVSPSPAINPILADRMTGMAWSRIARLPGYEGDRLHACVQAQKTLNG